MLMTQAKSEFAEAAQPHAAERRQEPRIEGPFPAELRFTDLRGQRVGVRATIESLSSEAFYLCSEFFFEPGRKIFVAARISNARVALTGLVLRVEPQPEGGWGLAVRIVQHRFI